MQGTRSEGLDRGVALFLGVGMDVFLILGDSLFRR